jgi:UDP-N-acetylmuramate--alanine ligase
MRALNSFDDLPSLVAQNAEPGDYVICLGAGDITKYANALAVKLAEFGK